MHSVRVRRVRVGLRLARTPGWCCGVRAGVLVVSGPVEDDDEADDLVFADAEVVGQHDLVG